MSKNHLIIGLGGTGGKIIRAFRKTIYQEFRQTDPPDVALGYLYVDSSDEMMSPDDPTWRILGRSVQIGTNSQLKITDANLQARLANIANYPGIKDWIGSADEWSSILRSHCRRDAGRAEAAPGAVFVRLQGRPVQADAARPGARLADPGRDPRHVPYLRRPGRRHRQRQPDGCHRADPGHLPGREDVSDHRLRPAAGSLPEAELGHGQLPCQRLRRPDGTERAQRRRVPAV